MKDQALNRLISDLNKVDETFMVNLYEELVAHRLQTALMQSLDSQSPLPGLNSPKTQAVMELNTTGGMAPQTRATPKEPTPPLVAA